MLGNAAMRTMRWVALLLFACSACSKPAPSETVGQGGKADGINPLDDVTLASLTVTAPAMAEGSLVFRRSELALGTPLRIVPGGGCLSLRSSYFSVPLELDCTLTLASSAPKIVALSILGSTWDRTSVETDFGEAAEVMTVDWQHRTVATSAPNGDLVPAGEYGFGFNYGVLGTATKTVKSGEQAMVDLTRADVRATVTIVPPPERLYPNPERGECETKERVSLVRRGGAPDGLNEPVLGLAAGIDKSGYSRTTSDAIMDWRLLKADATESFRVLPLVAYDLPHRYELVVNNLVLPLDLKAGESRSVYLKRLDVNDVRVTASDGTTTYAKGTYSVSYDDGGVWRGLYLVGGAWSNGIPCAVVTVGRGSFPTHTGLDVLPGKYKVVIEWTTAEGAKSSEHLITL